MAEQTPLLIRSFKNATDLSGKMYHFVDLSADNTVSLANGTKKPIGVLQETNKPGMVGVPVGVVVVGTTKVAVKKNANNDYPSAGDFIIAASDGMGIKRGTEDISLVRGMALQSASADGDIIEILLI